MDETIIEKLKRLWMDLSVKSDISFSQIKKIILCLDFIYEKVIYKTALDDYTQYRFYAKKNCERRRFINFGMLIKIRNICNNPSNEYMFSSKPEFNKKFNTFLHRQWLDAKTASFEQFSEFIRGKDSFFFKDPSGSFGIDSGIIKLIDRPDTEKLFEELKSKKILLEEVVKQHPELSAFNASSVNTMRVVTLIGASGEKEGDIHIMGSVFRVGRSGKNADNFHHNGIAALIDVDTGIVKTTGIDRDYKRYTVHPDSGIAIVGYKIPMWNKIIDTVSAAARVVPDVRYVGWDITVNDQHEVVIIEGNQSAYPDILQIPDQVGKWPLFKPFLDKLIK